MPTPDWFTPRSARLAARRLDPLAREVRREFRRLHAWAPVPVSDGPVEAEYFEAICLFHRVAARLAREGVLFRDLDRGWFQFPSRRAGRTVLLSWQLGQPAPCGWSERGERNVYRPVDEAGPWDDPSEAP
jgi:hypothetical protein